MTAHKTEVPKTSFEVIKDEEDGNKEEGEEEAYLSS